MTLRSLHLRTGRSAVEILIWLVVAAFLGSWLFPGIARVSRDSQETRDQHNARALVAIFNAASTTGLTFQGRSKEEIIDRLVSGAWATSGVFAGTFFGLPEMSEEEKLGAANFLAFEEGALRFTDGLETVEIGATIPCKGEEP